MLRRAFAAITSVGICLAAQAQTSPATDHNTITSTKTGENGEEMTRTNGQAHDRPATLVKSGYASVDGL
jgi:hypothetical protein